MLNLHGKAAIKSITLEMQEFPGILTKKDCILDIIGTTNAGKKILVELQQSKDKLFRDRVEYYISRVIENQVHTSEKYKLPQIYFLGLLDFDLFPDAPNEYIHHVDETCHGKKFFPKIQKVFVEIGKFLKLEKDGKTRNDHSDAAQWLRAIKAIIKEEPTPERILKNEIFKRLLNSVKLINFAEETFNLEVGNMTDVMAELENIFYKGERKGEKKGFQKGIKKEQANSEKKMKLFVKRIAKKTGMSQKELLALKP